MNITGKQNYICQKKISARDAIIPEGRYSHVIGLGGPQLDHYLERMISKGFKTVTSWELDAKTFLFQQIHFHSLPFLTMWWGDIIKAPLEDDTLYDLDLCCTVKSVPHHCIKFKERAIFTFALRGIGRDTTVKTFFDYRDERILRIESIEKAQKILTTEGEYTTISYCDTSPMLMITKNSTYE